MKAKISFLALACLAFAFMLTLPCLAGMWRDDFEDGNLDDWKQEEPFANQPTLWTIVDGELECTRPSEGSTFLITGEADWKDYTIEYDVKLLKDIGPGDVDVVARYKSPAWTYMMLAFSGDFPGVPVVATVCFPGSVLTSKLFDPLELDKWHHLKLEVKDKNFIFWVNGKIALERQDDVVKEGAVGIGLANYTARFDNVIITGSDVPDVTPPTWKGRPVQPRGKQATTWGEIKRR
ncbi:DUF1080 domain-containing protein [Candidatus Poribacteria bacterium]|nr:DUF1080 domain-containing protein [Candidatus Poribacteria bacterium]